MTAPMVLTVTVPLTVRALTAACHAVAALELAGAIVCCTDGGGDAAPVPTVADVQQDAPRGVKRAVSASRGHADPAPLGATGSRSAASEVEAAARRAPAAIPRSEGGVVKQGGRDVPPPSPDRGDAPAPSRPASAPPLLLHQPPAAEERAPDRPRGRQLADATTGAAHEVASTNGARADCDLGNGVGARAAVRNSTVPRRGPMSDLERRLVR